MRWETASQKDFLDQLRPVLCPLVLDIDIIPKQETKICCIHHELSVLYLTIPTVIKYLLEKALAHEDEDSNSMMSC